MTEGLLIARGGVLGQIQARGGREEGRVSSGFFGALWVQVFLFVVVSWGRWGVAAEYQWSVEVTGAKSPETQELPRAYLWIPPSCERLSGVVVAQHNLLEVALFNHPVFRKEMERTGFALLWVTPPVPVSFDGGEEDVMEIEGALRTLGVRSGYSELGTAPVVALGHSAQGDFPYRFAVHRPDRCLAGISLKGSWPDRGQEPRQYWYEAFGRCEVPVLFVSGEYEWADERAGRALAFRNEFPDAPFSMLVDVGAGHFDLHDRLAERLGRYVESALRARRGKPLKPVLASETGWLVDRWRLDKSPRAAAADVTGFSGDRAQTFWCFDEDEARATEEYQSVHQWKAPQLVGYRQAGVVVPQIRGTHQQVTLGWVPERGLDGLVFRLEGTFLEEVPAGRPERWTRLRGGDVIEHAPDAEGIRISPICGPAESLGGGLFTVRFDRVGWNNSKRSGEVWFQAEHPGNARHKRAVQQALMRVPARNASGAPQTIHFPEIADVSAAATTSFRLRAESDSGERVDYFVREGPARVEGDVLEILPIPVRAKYPIPVTVVAWQWGRSIEPRLQSATPVERTFHLMP